MGILAVCVSYGVLQANTAFAESDRERIEQIAADAVKKANDNGQAIAVTDAKVQAIVDSLARQEKIQEKTAAQLQMMLEQMIKNSGS
jgi:hypothetical protein